MIKKLVCFLLLFIISGTLISYLCSCTGDEEKVVVVNKQYNENETRIDFNLSTDEVYEKEPEDYNW